MSRLTNKMCDLISDFKSGPLDLYRKRASFDWKKLKVFLTTEEVLKYENDVYKFFQNHPEFKKTHSSLPFDEVRRIAMRRSKVELDCELLQLENFIVNPKKQTAAGRIMIQLSPDSHVKHSVGANLFMQVLRSSGSQRHSKYMEDFEDGKISGCYCLTEIGHGSNAKGMQTTATYDKQKKKFILNSPTFEAAKCWAGNLGQAATHGVVYAQLILDGKEYGLHIFVVPIRDPKTLQPYPGITVADLGEKIGLAGIDNGVLMFKNYEIPRENLLNKIGDVTEDGRYVTAIKDKNKRHGAALGTLSGGRVAITGIAEFYGSKALTIAVRYAAVRRQFGPEDGEEIPILEYPTHQQRLLPYLAAVYVIRDFATYFMEELYRFSIDQLMGQNSEDAPERGMEIHGVSAASKPIATWTMRDAIQECRETCGGHGYLRVAGIGDIRNDHDANLTYEGENHVLIQQTGNWLLKFWPMVLKREKISTPLHTLDFLSNGLEILERSKFNVKSVEELCQPAEIMKIYDWLVTYLLKKSHDNFEAHLRTGKSQFDARNLNQLYYSKSLSIAFGQRCFLQKFLSTIEEAPDMQIKNVLTRIFNLYGVWSLDKHTSFLYEGEYANGPLAARLIHEGVLKLCGDLKDDAVALVDVIAPPDFILNSVLGSSDGMVYKRLEEAVFGNPYNVTRPSWWKEIVNFKELVLGKSKL